MMTNRQSLMPFEQAAHAGQWLREQLGANAHITLDSRKIAKGDGFIAAPGLTVDGRQFVADALARGAAAVLQHADRPDDTDAGSVAPVPVRAMVGLAACTGEVAAAFYANPSEKFTVIAITGTNGKTSCANWAASGAAVDRRATAAIGTLGVSRFGQVTEQTAGIGEGSLTTPDAVTMQRVMAELVQDGVSLVAVEASSIGLDQNRLGGVQIDVAVFTNLTRDHLDYHGSMKAYEQAKTLLFQRPELEAAVVCGDDPAAGEMLKQVGAGVRTIAYGVNPTRYASGASEVVTIESIKTGAAKTQLRLTGDLGDIQADLALTGGFNAVNATGVWAAWRALGSSAEHAAQRLARLHAVTGRMQSIEIPQAPLVVIDYAHTPDALETALAALADQRDARGGELWCVFGCGGDRDAGKRAPMAAAAQAGANRLVLTSDNPRGESPQLILEQMQLGLSSAPWRVDADRRGAIEAAVLAAKPADIVLIAGKGHEAWQEIAGTKYPFSDEAVARSALLSRVSRAGGTDV